MQLVEKHIINRQHKFWQECDYLALQSKHLYNAANYVQRQYFFETKKYYNSIDIYHQTKSLESYRYLPTKVSKQIVRRVSEAWKCWLAALKDWSKHIEATRQIKELNSKRERRIDNYLHTVSRRVIDWCQLNDIGQLVIGNNQGWKQAINIGKKNNQDFTKIPHAKLINLLTYKAQLVGIEVVLTEESYTSKASALDGDILPVFNTQTDIKPVFSGKRIKRGLYKTLTGRTINADTNGSLNIARKVIPNFMDGIEALPFVPVVLGLWTKITNLVV